MDRRGRYLHEVGRQLAASLDLDATVHAVTSLAVPEIADWSAVFLLREDGVIAQLSVAHADAGKSGLVKEFMERFPPKLDDPYGAGLVIRTGAPVLRAHITDEALQAGARDAEHLALLRQVSPSSYIVVPLRARGRVLGALVLCHAESGRTYGEEDLRLAEDVAHLSAAAIENSRLYRAEQQARSLLAAQAEASPDGIFFQDATGRTAYYNARLLSMWGIDASVPGKATLEERLAAVVDRLVDPESFFRIARQLETQRERRLRFDVHAKGGLTFDCHTAPVVSLDGEYLGRAWYYRDVTAQRAMERELAQARRQLVESEKLALVGTLVSGVAHEIRTPLTYVRNHAYLVQRWAERALADPASARVEELTASVAAIQEGADRAGGLVGELRRFARTPSEKPMVVQVDEAVRSAVLIFEATHRHRVQLEATFGNAGDARVRTSEIEQVVLNLLENAADASPAGGRVRLATARGANGPEITVSDAGAGIPGDVQARMFEPFFTTKPEGLGLGLSIVRRIVHGAGGSIACKSAAGEGTTFTIRFPRA